MAEASSSYPIRISRDFESTSSDSSLGYCALKFSHNPPSLQQQAESSSSHRGVLHRGASPSSSSKAEWLLEYPRKSSASSSNAAHVFAATQSQISSQQGHTDVLLIWDEKSKSYVLEPVQGSVTLRYQRGKSTMSAPGVAILDKLAGNGKNDNSNRKERSAQEQPRRSRQEGSPIEVDDLDEEAPASKKRRRLVEDQPGLALPSGSRAATPQSSLVLLSSAKKTSRSDEEEDNKRSSLPSQRSNEAPVGLGLDLNDDLDQPTTRSSTPATRSSKDISHAIASRTERVATPGASKTVVVSSRVSPPEPNSTARSAVSTDAKDQDITSSGKNGSDKDSNKTSQAAAVTVSRGTTPAPAVLTPVLRASTSTLPVPSSPLVPLSRSTSSTTTTSWRPPAHHRNLSEGGSGIAIGTGVTSEDEDEEDEDEDDEDEEDEESEGDGDLEDFARQLEEELAGV